MTTVRQQSALVGALFLVTHVTSVGAVVLYGPMLDGGTWLTQDGEGTRQLAGALLDVILAVAVIGTGLALLPLLRDKARGSAAAYLMFRAAEAAVILAGTAAVIALVWLRSAGQAGAEAGAMLLELYRAAFLVGPGLVIGVNTVVLALALRRHRLVPGWIPVLGLIGAPLVVLSNLAVMFGVQEQVSQTAMLAAVPIFAWEISLAVYLLARGIRQST
jgi:hypothetical protein